MLLFIKSMRCGVLLLIYALLNSYSLFAQMNKIPQLPVSDNDRFTIIAHRGASAYAPENTHSAFRMAIEMKAEMIELDVLLSKDGIPVVIHDEKLKRTSSGKGKVHDYTLSELKKLDMGKWFSDAFKGEPFPTLEEVLSYTKNTIAVNIEIKTEAVTDNAFDGVVEKTLNVVRKAGVEDQVVFSSFDYRVMRHLEVLAPDMPKAILYEKRQSKRKLPSELVKEYKVDAFNCSYKQLSDKWVKDLTSHNIPFNIYTVDDESKMKELIQKGAAGIFSNKPDVLRRVVENL